MDRIQRLRETSLVARVVAGRDSRRVERGRTTRNDDHFVLVAEIARTVMERREADNNHSARDAAISCGRRCSGVTAKRLAEHTVGGMAAPKRRSARAMRGASSSAVEHMPTLPEDDTVGEFTTPPVLLNCAAYAMGGSIWLRPKQGN